MASAQGKLEFIRSHPPARAGAATAPRPPPPRRARWTRGTPRENRRPARASQRRRTQPLRDPADGVAESCPRCAQEGGEPRREIHGEEAEHQRRDQRVQTRFQRAEQPPEPCRNGGAPLVRRQFRQARRLELSRAGRVRGGNDVADGVRRVRPGNKIRTSWKCLRARAKHAARQRHTCELTPVKAVSSSNRYAGRVMSFSCPHFRPSDEHCLRLNTVCVPGRRGCVLPTTAVYAVPAEIRVREKEEEMRKQALEKILGSVAGKPAPHSSRSA